MLESIQFKLVNRKASTAPFFLLLLFSLNAFAGPKTYGSVYISEVRSIYDGDTFKANIDGWPKIIGQSISIRINGIDTPEMRSKCKKEKDLARKAKKFTVAMLRNAKQIQLRNIKRGKYFRIIADVYADNVSVGQQLLDHKLAYRYKGKTKKSWCDP